MMLDEVWQTQFRWRDCEDPRPFVIVDLSNPDAPGCFPIATECYRGRDCLYLDQQHPDFVATGLTKSCHIHYESIYAIPRDCLIRRRGHLTGELLAELRRVAGL